MYAPVPPKVSPQSSGRAKAFSMPGFCAAAATVDCSTTIPSPISRAASRAAKRASACAASRASAPDCTRP